MKIEIYVQNSAILITVQTKTIALNKYIANLSYKFNNVHTKLYITPITRLHTTIEYAYCLVTKLTTSFVEFTHVRIDGITYKLIKAFT